MLSNFYGITVRSLELFYKLFLIDAKARKAVQLCPFVKTGIMHNDFQKFLRPDGLGIDYTHLEDYSTLLALDKNARKKVPQIEKSLKNAMQEHDKGLLDYALYLAREIKLERYNPKLMEEAESMFKALQGNQ